MTDLGLTIAPSSLQLNADDLTAGPMTIKITKVMAKPESAEQPIAISFEGDNGRPFMPCKTVRRIMVQVWGRDGNDYVGRSMTIYRDPDVTWGGMKVGGIRISHMSNIDRPVTVAVTASRSSRKPVTVKPLEMAKAPPKREPVDDYADHDTIDWPTWLADMGKKIDACETNEALAELQVENAGDIAELGRMKPKLAERLGMRFGDRSRAILGEGDDDA